MCRIVKLKKAVLFTLIFTVLMFCTAVSAGADDSINSDYEDIYNEVYGIAGADTLTDALPNKVKRELKKAGVTAPRWEELNSLSFSEIMENIISEAGEQSVTPLNSLVKITGILIIAAFINSIKTTVASGALTGVLDCVSVLAESIVLIRPLTDVIEYSSTVVKLSADFMLVFVPVMAAVMTAMGQTVQSVGNYTAVMGAGTAVSQVSEHILIPLLNSFLGISVVSGISEKVSLDGFCELISRIIKWVLTFVMSVFTAVLTMQSIVSVSADSAGTRAARFAISSFVPLVGGALSEAYQTVRGCMGMLKSGVGVFAILATAAIYLPAVISCVMWLISLNIATALAGVFDMGRITALLRSIGMVINVLIAVLLCCMMIFIISSAVMLMVGGG